jgi:hypothetical protein
MEDHMDSQQYTPRLGFWLATTSVIIVTVFAVVLRGAGPGNGGGRAADLWLTFGLALLPGGCIGLLQAWKLAFPSTQARVQWFGITVVSTALGWCIVFALMNFLDRRQLLPVITSELLPATLDGLITGAMIGAIIGITAGIIQGRVQPLSSRQWIVGNLISWSIGIAVPLAVFFALLSQIDFFFMM